MAKPLIARVQQWIPAVYVSLVSEVDACIYQVHYQRAERRRRITQILRKNRGRPNISLNLNN